MLIVSCRKNFTDPINFGPTAWKWSGSEVSYEDHPPVVYTVLIHGYHTTADSAEENYNQIAGVLDPNLQPSGYLWPGGNLAIDYPLSVIRAAHAGWRLRDWLMGLNDGSIDIQTHSLGARVACEALNYGGLKVRNLILCAPAIFANSFDPGLGGEFGNVPKYCDSVKVAFSKNDPVLARDFNVGQFFRGGPAMGLVGSTHLPGNVRQWDFSKVVNSHSGYRTCPDYFKFWEGK